MLACSRSSGTTVGSVGVVGSVGAHGSEGVCGSHGLRSPLSMSHSKKVRPSAANARGHLTVNPSGDVSLSIFPA